MEDSPDPDRDGWIGMEQQSHLQGELEPSEVKRRFPEVHKPSADAWLMWKTDIYATALWLGWFLLSFEYCDLPQ